MITLYGTTIGEDIFDAVSRNLGKSNLPLDRLVSVTTDGSKSMTADKLKDLCHDLQENYKMNMQINRKSTLSIVLFTN